MSKSPSFQFFTKEWLSSDSILFMKPEEEGAYIHLLAYQWEDPTCTLPDDDNKLATLSGLGERWLSNGHSKVIRECFPPCTEMPGRLRNNRLYMEKLRQEEWRRKSSAGGVAGSKSRWEKKKRGRKGGQEVVTAVVKDCSQPNDDIAVCSLQSAICNIPPTPQGGGQGAAFLLAKLYVSSKKGPTTPVEAVQRWFQSAIEKGVDPKEIERVIYDPKRMQGFQAWEIGRELEKEKKTKFNKPEIYRASKDAESLRSGKSDIPANFNRETLQKRLTDAIEKSKSTLESENGRPAETKPGTEPTT